MKNFKDYAELIIYCTHQIDKIKRLTKTIDTLPDGTNEIKWLSQDSWWFVMIQLFLLWIVPSYLHPVIMNPQQNILWIIWLGVIECFLFPLHWKKPAAFSLEMETGFAFLMTMLSRSCKHDYSVRLISFQLRSRGNFLRMNQRMIKIEVKTRPVLQTIIYIFV